MFIVTFIIIGLPVTDLSISYVNVMAIYLSNAIHPRFQ